MRQIVARARLKASELPQRGATICRTFNSPACFMFGSRVAPVVLALAGLCGCGHNAPSIAAHRDPSPALGASLVPQATSLADGKMLLSWQKPLSGGGYTFEMAIRDRDGWSDVRTIAAGTDLSMFSADLPGVATLSNGRLLAYWELKDPRDGDPYATTIQTATSDDEGRNWSRADAIRRTVLWPA